MTDYTAGPIPAAAITTEAERFAAFGSHCDASTMSPVAFQPDRVYLFATFAHEAARALGAVLTRYGYDVGVSFGKGGDTGTYNCRRIGGGTSGAWSAHAWGTAVDINWQSNPDGSTLITDIPRGAVDEIEALYCVDAAGNRWPVWRWGGDWDRNDGTGHSYYDPMHFEIIARPEWLERGVYDPNTEGGNMINTGLAAAELQRDLVELGYDLGDFTPYAGPFPTWYEGPQTFPPGADGEPGAKTLEALDAFAAAVGLTAGNLTAGTAALVARYARGAVDVPEHTHKHWHGAYLRKADLSDELRARLTAPRVGGLERTSVVDGKIKRSLATAVRQVAVDGVDIAK